jgi:D-alanine-D-alanine ligase
MTGKDWSDLDRVRIAHRAGRVAVLYGGTSAERPVSLKSGAAVLAALRRSGVAAEAVDVMGDPTPALRAGGFDRVFIALHGRGGEDGALQGLLEILELPYTGCGVLASALAMDKPMAKRIWRAEGLPTPPFLVVSGPARIEGLPWQALGLPLMVKPAREGSSFGASICRDEAGLAAAIARAQEFDPEVLVERFVSGPEYTVGIVAGRVLPVIRLEPAREFYDYEAKYLDSGTRYHCPAGLSPAVEQEIQALALRAFQALSATGWGRVDLILDEAGGPWLIELNTVPGMTDHSLVPMAAAAAGLDFDGLCLEILASAFPSAPPGDLPSVGLGEGG